MLFRENYGIVEWIWAVDRALADDERRRRYRPCCMSVTAALAIRGNLTDFRAQYVTCRFPKIMTQRITMK